MLTNDEKRYFKNKLIEEKNRIEDIIGLMNKNETIGEDAQNFSELSLYDNHTGDIGSEVTETSKSIALKNNEDRILAKVNNAIANIDNGSYGICKSCGREINKERLQFIPYAEYCVECQNSNSFQDRNEFDRFKEQSPFVADKYTVAPNPVEYYESVESFNQIDNIYEFGEYIDYSDVVDPLDNISNEYYKRTL
ncbi:TraR/DksA C4-type zinc finger protein [uncultured Clostridium sp.]|uniref:TraR/DksA C4-type zinc finger protein n=1 Tax=uncultured Clostridium sp. TaxID=59620 RepID=UPI0025DA9A61|nr:TraR/DksA C4-type zinc finger protein [uncultured Clostridium sp.]